MEQWRRSRLGGRTAWIGVIAALALVAVSCGSEGDADTTTGATQGEQTASTSSADPSSPDAGAATEADLCGAVVATSAAIEGSPADLTSAIRSLDSASVGLDERPLVEPILGYGLTLEGLDAASSDAEASDLQAAELEAEDAWGELIVWADRTCEPVDPLWACIAPSAIAKFAGDDGPLAEVERDLDDSGFIVEVRAPTAVEGQAWEGLTCSGDDEQAPVSTVGNEVSG